MPRGAPASSSSIELADDPRAAELIAALARAGGDHPVVVTVDHAPAPRPGLVVHVAPALDVDGVAAVAAAMLGGRPPPPWAHALHLASGGLPLTVIELRAIARRREGAVRDRLDRADLAGRRRAPRPPARGHDRRRPPGRRGARGLGRTRPDRSRARHAPRRGPQAPGRARRSRRARARGPRTSPR